MNPIVKIYQKRVGDAFAELSEYAKPGGIVFLGDSITEFFRVNEFFPGAYVINRGIGSDTTEGVLKRLPESVYNLSPSKVFILIGTNDIAQKESEQSIIGHIWEIITRIQENCPETQVYLQSIYPVSLEKNKKIRRNYVAPRDNEIIRSINEKLRIMAGEKGISYIDIYSFLVNEEGNIHLEYTVEGLHLTICGSHKVAELLMPFVMNNTK
jgi:lysophospholipase L1-like esterase